MKIFNNGSSFAYGKYPEYVAKGLNAELENVAMPGYANHSIWRRTLEYDPKNYDLALIQLTTPSRLEFHRGKQWIEISAQLSHPKLSEYDKRYWQYYYENIYDDKMGDVDEDMAITGIRDHFAVAKIPCIIVTSEKYTKSKKFDINLWDTNFPLDNTRHPSDIGHRVISKRILSYYETIISGM